jgi:butyrate kinase
MTTEHQILIINPGSTSTKMGIGCKEEVTVETIHHAPDELEKFPDIWSQFEYRLELCKKWASREVKHPSAVVAIGGLFRPVEGGTYRVNEKMLEDARNNVQGEHASNLGCALAYELAADYHVPAFVVDPVSVDEFEPLARYSGHPLIVRKSLSHALNIHAAARQAAKEMNLHLSQSSFVVGHLGGGISIAPVRNGKIIDVNDAASDGPFSPERTGGLPLQAVISLCFSGNYSEREMRSLVMGKGGLVAYLETNSVAEVEKRIECGDIQAKEIFQAMAYQIAKEIGAMATVLNGVVDAIILTGGVTRSKRLTSWIDERVHFIAPVIVYPGEFEMQALYESALRVLYGEEQVKEY